MEVTLYLSGSTQPIVTQSLNVQSSTTVQVQIAKYVVLAGLLVDTSDFATIIVIVLAVALVLALEVYRFRRSKARKSETESSDKES
jgi:heme/copper-type cytochrome/quinol oxidase subunit 2